LHNSSVTLCLLFNSCRCVTSLRDVAAQLGPIGAAIQVCRDDVDKDAADVDMFDS
jgi:hypothetical protein